MVLFVLGFLLYSLLYAALGSLVSRQEDVQSATSPLMMLIMVGYFMSIFALQSIDDTWVKVALVRAVLQPVPDAGAGFRRATSSRGSSALAWLIMLAAIAVALFVAARIYSAGVLLYGQRVGLRQVLKAARVSR
jgi:ABC-2 type transport system permease protein